MATTRLGQLSNHAEVGGSSLQIKNENRGQASAVNAIDPGANHYSGLVP